MAEQTLQADYLVVGAGAAGLAFTDALTAACGASVVVVDRRHAPGGHWNDAYPFVRLHQPSDFYGVNSLSLGEGTRASGPEIVGYFRRVMDERLLPSGRVRYFPCCEYVGNHRFVSRLTGDRFEVEVSERLVDATYLEPRVPATEAPPFEVAPGVACVPVNDLVHVAEPPDRIVVIGGGKTGMDACLWLLDNGYPADAIDWIRPRDSLVANRQFSRPGGPAFEGFSLLVQAAAHATDHRDLVDRAVAAEQFFPLDERVEPTMFKYATVDEHELAQLRSIESVVRLGHVQRLEPGRILLDGGTFETSRGALHVHCAAAALRLVPGRPIFEERTITLQPIRAGQAPFAAAITGFVEATRADVGEKNRLCPPNPYMDTPSDLARTILTSMGADYQWSKHPDIVEWLEGSRLNATRGVLQLGHDPTVQHAMGRFALNARAAVSNLRRLAEVSPADARQ